MKENAVASHYSQDNLLKRILDGLEKSGKSKFNVTIDDLGPVDEFHTGGRVATAHLLDDLQINAGDLVLDVGCGIGGTSRYLANKYNVNVQGVDLTNEYINTGNELNNWVDLAGSIDLHCSDAADLPCENDEFDLAVMLHVGMNIEDKSSLFAEVARVLKKNATFAIYDVMRKDKVDLTYPMPWATDASMSFLEPEDSYIDHLKRSGFVIKRATGRGEFAKSFFRKMQATAKLADSPPAIGLQLLVGPSIKEKMMNFSQAIFDDIVEPTEIIVTKL